MSARDPKDIEQPPIGNNPYGRKGAPSRRVGPMAGQPRYNAGSKRSVAVLRELSFDPIKKLVERYQEMENEVAFWKAIRDRTLIQIINSEGKERYYDSDAHMQAEKMLIEIGDKLLRYGYGRVPETVNVNDTRLPTMIVNLTKEGDKQHFINEVQDYIEHDDT